MKFDNHDTTMTYQDEFDVYFARAKLDEQLSKEKQEGSQNKDNNRRGSLPGEPVIPVFLEVQPHHRRALSCKLPSKRKSTRRGSRSPRERHSPPPPASSSSISQANKQQDMATIPLINHTHHQNVESDDHNEDDNTSDTELEMQGISMNYITEPTLRAPSPRLMGGSSSPRCQSAPHSRSSSWKNKKRPSSFRQSRNSVRESDSPAHEANKSRHGSVTQFEEEVTQKLEQLKLLQAEDVCVVRNFSTSSKGLINRGDSFKRKPRSSTASVASSSDVNNPNSSVRERHSSSDARNRNLSVGSCNTGSSLDTPPIHKVLVIGDKGVGKTALLQQFMTSHYMGAAETSFDDEIEKTVTVLSDGEETMIDFVEVPVEQDLSQYGTVDGYLLCFSITSKPSFYYMKDVIESISKSSETKHLAKIMVANKSDLVRKRQVSENDARSLCIKTNCKYVEVSAAINHKVDDLLVGITTQIRLNPKRKEERKSDGPRNISCVSAKGLMQLIFKRNHQTSKSCDNLLEL